jgi:hypothetical protein
MVAAIAIIKAEMAEDCGDPSPGANQLLDAAVRARVLAALKCHQRQVHRLQSGLHSIIQGYVANVVQLKLPPFTQEKMLAEARACPQAGCRPRVQLRASAPGLASQGRFLDVSG